MDSRSFDYALELSEEFRNDADVIELVDLIAKARELLKDSPVKEDIAD